jgi:hypothetical protein
MILHIVADNRMAVSQIIQEVQCAFPVAEMALPASGQEMLEANIVTECYTAVQLLVG